MPTHLIQVTVYEGDGLFVDTQCPNLTTPMLNTTVRGEVITPIISVVNEGTAPGSEADEDEEVIITYSRAPYGLTEGGRYVCARWNSSVNCGGGGWTVRDCSLTTTPSGSYQCRCLHQGTFTLLDVSEIISLITIQWNQDPPRKGQPPYKGHSSRPL